jgi:hypothetical protein
MHTYRILSTLLVLVELTSAVPVDVFEQLRRHTQSKRQEINGGQFADEYTNHPSFPTLTWFPCYGPNNYQCAR